MHSQLHEDFLNKPSEVNEVLKFLTEIQKGGKEKGPDIDYSAGVTDDNFLVTQRMHYNVKKSRSLSRKFIFQPNMNQMTFMRQIDVSEETRKKARTDRMLVANNYRRLGNAEYRRNSLDKAIEFYTKGINYINDSPVLFVNRALCNIKKREYKRGLLDLDHVLNNLDERCLRAWLYKAAALKRMNNEAGFEQCVASARRLNRAGAEYIAYFLDKMRTDF